jgi:hypothetical protein
MSEMHPHQIAGTLAGDGERIICEDNNGLRWEPLRQAMVVSTCDILAIDGSPVRYDRLVPIQSLTWASAHPRVRSDSRRSHAVVVRLGGQT